MPLGNMQLAPGQSYTFETAVSLPATLDNLNTLPHVEGGIIQWRRLMARNHQQFSQAAATNHIHYLACSLCSNNHTFDHCGGETITPTC